jgi:Family of unknown function (DUF6011)
MSTCLRCHRPLKDPKSIQRGFGPICAAAIAAPADPEHNPVLLEEGGLEAVGLVCRRLPDGRLACNIIQVYKHHSPTGFECGYGGSGPADLALNVLAILLPRGRKEEGVKLWDDQRVSQTAWDLHEDFKWKFIAPMDREGGTVPIADIRVWLEQEG